MGGSAAQSAVLGLALVLPVANAFLGASSQLAPTRVFGQMPSVCRLGGRSARGSGDSSRLLVMAAKGGAKKKGTKPAFKGFGGLPDKLIDRTPESADEDCVCCSGKSYKDCCQPFHSGDKWPSSPLELMRSRYSAYAYRLPDWVIGTTHKTNVDWKADSTSWRRELLGFCDGFEFLGLEVLEEDAGENDKEYFITFLAKLCTKKQPTSTSKNVKETFSKIKSQHQNDALNADFKERSRFLLGDEGWMYVEGDVDFDPQVEVDGELISASTLQAQRIEEVEAAAAKDAKVAEDGASKGDE